MMKNKHITIYVILVIAMFALASCARNADFYTVSSPYQVRHQRDFLGGGSNWDNVFQDFLIGRTTADSAPAQAAPPPPVATPVPAMAPPPPDSGTGQVDWEDIAGTGERHIIQTADVEMETEDFYDVISQLRQLAPAADGYIESEMLTARGWRMFTIVLRIPAPRFEATLRHVESLADVRITTQRAEDVTDRFYDTAGNLETRRIEEDRILALIEATDNVNDLLALEARLSNTRLSIRQYESQLSNLAGQIAYSTINVTLHDMYQIQPFIAPTLGERIGGAFGDSVDGTISFLQNVVVFLAGAVIPLAIIAIIIFAVYKVIRRVYSFFQKHQN